MKKTLLVTVDFAPNHGGVATYWKRVQKSLPEEKFLVLTSVPCEKKEKNVTRTRLLYKFLCPRWIKGIFKIERALKTTGAKHVLVGQVLPVGIMVYILKKYIKISYSGYVFNRLINKSSSLNSYLYISNLVGL